MSVYREKKFHLLVLLVVLSLLVVWKPWDGLTPAARGLPLSVETSDGSAVLLDFQNSIVSFKSSNSDLEKTWDSIVDALSPNWDLDIISIDQNENLIRFELGGRVTQTYVNTYVGTLGQVENIEEGKVWNAGKITVQEFQRRIDEYKLAGTKIRLVGENHVLIETKENVDEIKLLLTKSGRFELFVQDVLAVASNEIIGVGKASQSGSYSLLPAYFTENGRNRFNTAVSGKAGESLMVYFDRPFDAVIIFEPQLLNELTTFVYDNVNHHFKENVTDQPITVTAFSSDPTKLSENVRQYLLTHTGDKLHVILLGSKSDFSEGFLEAIPDSYTYEVLKQEPDEPADDWIARASGFVSSFPIPESIAENGISERGGINVPLPYSLSKTREYRSLVLHKLPVRISSMEVTVVEPTYKSAFVESGLMACLAGLIGVAFLSVRKFKQHDVGLVTLAIGATNFILVLGLFVATGIAITASEMLFLIGIYFVCLIHQTMVTREMLVGIAPGERVKVGWRIPKALNPVYLGSALGISVMIILGALGVFVVWGATIVLAMILVINGLLVAPIYARMLEEIILRGGRREHQHHS